MKLFYLYVVFLISLGAACAGTVADIRNKTGWQPPNHSERGYIYIPLISPAVLIANLTKYNRDRIQMRVLFHGITTQTLNTMAGPKHGRRRWPSERYISFRIKDPREQVSPKDINMFISRNNPDSDKLFELTQNTPIVVVGTVRDTAKGKAWIEVEKIELL